MVKYASQLVSGKISCFAAALASASVLAGAAALPAATTMPTTQARSAQQIQEDLRQTSSKLQDTLGGLPGLADASHRAAVTPQATPLLKRMLADFDEFESIQPKVKPQLATARQQFTAILVVLGDKPTQDAVSAKAASTTPADMIDGKSVQLMSRWLANRDVAAETSIVDDLQKLDEANPSSAPLTIFNVVLSRTAASPQLTDRLQALATGTMKNPTATRLTAQLAQMKDQEAAQATAAKKMKELEGQPLVVTGKTVDGKSFSTVDWKGKVVLVDFWATWCGPCKAELPRVKQIYSEDHAKGLEILGVSNDYDAQTLIDFTQKDEMPWPQLFDSAAASDHQWNPTTLAYGINAIPVMFLIDKKGVLRSVSAREDMETLIPKLLTE